MRNLSNSDKETMKALDLGAAAAAGKADTNKKIQALQEDMKLLRYAMMKYGQAMTSYPTVRNQVEDLDYRTLAIARVLKDKFPNFDAEVEAAAKVIKAETFDELSAADDKDKNLTDAPEDALTENHYVILTSECEANRDLGIFRSKMDVGGAEFAELKDAFLGKKAGDTVTAKIQGQEHLFTVLGVRRKPGGANEQQV